MQMVMKTDNAIMKMV